MAGKYYESWEYHHILGPKIYTRKIGNIHKSFNFAKPSYIIFYAKMSQYLHYTYWLQEEPTHLV